MAIGGRSVETPDTPGDWSALILSQEADFLDDLDVRAWVSTGPTPDLNFTDSNDGIETETTMCSWRVSDATGNYRSSVGGHTFAGSGDVDLPDVALAYDGVAFCGINDAESGTIATSLGWTQDYSGDAGATNYNNNQAHALSIEGITPGGSTWDAGTVNFSGDSWCNILVVNLETGGAPVAATDQEGYRWGSDDDTESGHGWEAGQDTDPATLPAETTELLRVLVDETAGGVFADGLKLQYRRDDEAGDQWRDVT